MYKFYEVSVNQIGKPIGNNRDNFSSFNQETHKFQTIKEVKEWLKEIYGKCKKQKMYVDGKNGDTQHIGYIYCFKNKDWSHNTESWWQQDWVSIKEMKATTILI